MSQFDTQINLATRLVPHGAELRAGVSIRAHQHRGVFVHREGKTGYATGLINLARNIGGSSGIAICTTMIAQREQFHQQRLIEHFSPLDPAYQTALAGMKQMLMVKGSDPAQAATQAQGMLYGTLQQQAAMLSFNEVFWVLGVAFLVVIPLMFLMKKTGPVKGAIAIE